jgi:hypothetical protein
MAKVLLISTGDNSTVKVGSYPTSWTSRRRLLITKRVASFPVSAETPKSISPALDPQVKLGGHQKRKTNELKITQC